jgi:hypothetical protein
MLQVAVDSLGVAPPAQVSFTNDVFPLLSRTRRLQWVNTNINWTRISDDWAALADASSGAAQLRSDHVDVVREVGAILHQYSLTARQDFVLDEWAAGRFQSDWTGVPGPAPLTADGMTAAALQSSVGQGFFPGIEAGILVTDPTIYATPFDFRLDHAQVSPGDMTAQMAVPWQADFNDCALNWWPSQRPNDVRLSATSNGTAPWARGVSTHLGMVANFPKLAFITAQKDAGGNVVFAEDQRAASAVFV